MLQKIHLKLFFYILRFKEIKNKVCQSGPLTLVYRYHLKNRVSNSEEKTQHEKRLWHLYLFMRKVLASKRVCLVKYLRLVPLKSNRQMCQESKFRFLTLDFKTKLITSESTIRRSLCGMVVYMVLKSKVEIDLVFLLTLIFQLSDNWKIILRNPEFLTTRI